MKRINWLLCVIVFLGIVSCKKFFPVERDSIDAKAGFIGSGIYSPVLGKNTVYSGIFNYGKSSIPLDFEMINLRRYDGSPAPELTDSVYSIKVWKRFGTGGYTGEEKSLEEIEAKRTTENHRIVEMEKYSGNISVWSGMNTDAIISLPDSGYKFDVKVSNSGATRYYYNLRFMPYKPQYYAPNVYDVNTGMRSGVALLSGTSGISVTGMVKKKDNTTMLPSDVDVYFIKRPDTPEPHTLSFVFMDSVFRPIDPALFSQTDWDNLVHGFNKRITPVGVTYDMAYPMPLVEQVTKYTNTTGNRATVNFSYYRVVPGGSGTTANLRFSFAIWQPGNWEIRFVFKNSSPKFSGDL